MYFHSYLIFNKQVILAARSRYFNSMFLSGMTECNQEEIEIKGKSSPFQFYSSIKFLNFCPDCSVINQDPENRQFSLK